MPAAAPSDHPKESPLKRWGTGEGSPALASVPRGVAPFDEAVATRGFNRLLSAGSSKGQGLEITGGLTTGYPTPAPGRMGARPAGKSGVRAHP